MAVKLKRRIMKKIVEDVQGEGLEKFLGEKILLMCGCYFYAGILKGVNDDCVLLEDASIVYETGPWNEGSYEDSQRLHSKQWYVSKQSIESFGAGK
jgi:hypothetical protein